jgi:hypothetical protein
MVTVNYDELEEAFMFVNSGELIEHGAYISLDTGKIYYVSEDCPDDDAPDDIEESDRYVAVPGKFDLELGQELVFGFVEQEMPDFYEEVHDIFHRKGAYRRFKDFLEQKGLLEKWYKFEADATEKALREWCAENGIEVVEKKERPKS